MRAITITASLAGYRWPMRWLPRRRRAEVLPSEARISYRGQSLGSRISGALYVTFAMALLVVFLVLAAQFEKLHPPLVILLSTPLAITGGLLALWWTGSRSTSSARSRHDPADRADGEERHSRRRIRQPAARPGMTVRDAVLEASVVRPADLMTSTTVLGVRRCDGRGGAESRRRSA